MTAWLIGTFLGLWRLAAPGVLRLVAWLRGAKA
jgi:hypothetical protein